MVSIRLAFFLLIFISVTSASQATEKVVKLKLSTRQYTAGPTCSLYTIRTAAVYQTTPVDLPGQDCNVDSHDTPFDWSELLFETYTVSEIDGKFSEAANQWKNRVAELQNEVNGLKNDIKALSVINDALSKRLDDLEKKRGGS